jgi:hypothetical protein
MAINTVLPYVTINGVEFKEFDAYKPSRFDITKGGRNELTGKNNLRLIAKKWKLVLGAAYISDAVYKQITDFIDQNSLDVNVTFRDKDTANLVSINCYAVYDKDRTKEADAMGCWSNFSLELIEN